MNQYWDPDTNYWVTTILVKRLFISTKKSVVHSAHPAVTIGTGIALRATPWYITLFPRTCPLIVNWWDAVGEGASHETAPELDDVLVYPAAQVVQLVAV